MIQELIPTNEEIRVWLLSTLRHSCQVEYYLGKLNLGHNDPQRPHDIVGEGNKFSWPVIRGLAIQYRSEDPEFFDRHVLPSIEHHRNGQYHHQMWNFDNPYATPDDMKVGAVDALCSLLDKRDYQGGAHTFEDIITIIKCNEPYKHKWFYMVYSQMKRLPPPDLKLIHSLEGFPNLGIPQNLYERTQSAISETKRFLREEKGYNEL